METEKKWKIMAIVFMGLFVIETLGVIWLFNVGSKSIDQENECVYNICGDDKYDSYYIDEYEEICYCVTNGEIEYQEYLG